MNNHLTPNLDFLGCERTVSARETELGSFDPPSSSALTIFYLANLPPHSQLQPFTRRRLSQRTADLCQ